MQGYVPKRCKDRETGGAKICTKEVQGYTRRGAKIHIEEVQRYVPKRCKDIEARGAKICTKEVLGYRVEVQGYIRRGAKT